MSAVALTRPSISTRATLSFFDSLVVARRNLMQIVRIPAVLVFELVQPVMFVLLFRFVFAGNISGMGEIPGGYVVFLMPGIIVQNAIFGATTTAIGIAEDLKAGLVDRFRSLPMARSAMLAGRATSDLIKNFILLLVVIGIGYLVGFSFRNGFVGAIAMIVLVMAVSFTFSWVMATIALAVKKLEAVQAAAFTGIFPLVFMSSALVPVVGCR
jgi:ABC-type multidrug transport system permease subunit